MPDRSIRLTPDRKDALRHLLAAEKFGADAGTFYPGTHPERARVACEGHINSLLKRLLNIPGESVLADVVFKEVRRTLGGIDAFDSGERDRICYYLEQVMDILGVESSADLLNKWRYGIDQ